MLYVFFMYGIYNIKYKDYIKICRSKSIFLKGKQSNRKINGGYAQTFHQRGNRKGQCIPGKRPNLFGNQQNKH